MRKGTTLQRHIYEIWRGMIKRCENTNHSAYFHYGGRGIKVCEEWHDFEIFYYWALESGCHSELTLDRIDVDGNYEPENCRWATYKQQAINKRLSSTTKCVKCGVMQKNYSIRERGNKNNVTYEARIELDNENGKRKQASKGFSTCELACAWAEKYILDHDLLV